MPRVVRGLADNYIYHIINRGNGRQEVFHKERDYEAFIDIMKEAKKKHQIKLFSYCLMPNHFHMILMPEHGNELSRSMQWLMTSHVRRYHRHYGSSGHIWQGRYKSFIIQKDAHLLMAMRYVEGNPIRAGLVRSAKEWAWSSHREMIGGKKNILAGEVPIELPENWERYVDEPLTYKELESVRQSVIRQSPYGKPDWQMKVCKELGLESTLNPKGRLRKEKRA